MECFWVYRPFFFFFLIFPSLYALVTQVSTLGFDDALITSEFEKLSQVFSAGAAKNFPPLPLTAIVVQVLTPCS